MSEAPRDAGNEWNLAEDGDVSHAYTPPSQEYNPEPDREKIRGKIAQELIWLLIGIIVLSLILVLLFPGDLEKIKTVLELILSPLFALVGTATGFYFGANSKK